MRILITGSRKWTDRYRIAQALTLQLFSRQPGDVGTVIVHGDCPTGADAIAKELAIECGIPHEPHPAMWAAHGQAAGPIRNYEMVELGADVCLAFPLGKSAGTRHCMSLAKAHGIKVINYGNPV